MKNKISAIRSKAFFLSLALVTSVVADAAAMEIDWSGQFRAESHYVRNFTLGQPRTTTATGYSILNGGDDNASFQTLFLRLQPKLIVNDNIYVKTEWWLNDPVFGFFGDAYPNSFDQRQFYSTQSRGSVISAQRFWAELLTDIGTVHVGRAPLDWGLGVVWDSGDGPWDRYQSTGDVIRMVSKFGAFTFIPSIIKYSAGNSVGGNCLLVGAGCVPGLRGGVSDYSLAFKYENPDDQLEAGLNFIRRISGGNQESTSGVLGLEGPGTAVVLNYNTWDIYARKRLGKFSFAAEVPIVTGRVGRDYDSFAIAFESEFKPSETWDMGLKAGYVPGQPSTNDLANEELRTFYFHPGYRVGLIMFNYQFNNFAGPNTSNNPAFGRQALTSPFDNPVTNAAYGTLGGQFHLNKWHLRTNFIYARALETASAGEAAYFNTWRRTYEANTSGESQGKSLGFEWDLGATYEWDDTFSLNLDGGLFLPGGFYKFSNTGNANETGAALAFVAGFGISF